MDEIIHHFAVFVSRLWQIHIFGEGNTRTTAVFFIKYLRTLGFDVTNDIFAENAWYFRNALVRANYNDLKNGVHETTEYLELFLRNLLLDEKNELHNRSMHISGQFVQSANSEASKSQNGTLKLTPEELGIVKLLLVEPKATQKRISEATGISERTVKRRTVAMQEKGLICRENGKRNGRWKVLIEL
jgi:Protein involved in cell division